MQGRNVAVDVRDETSPAMSEGSRGQRRTRSSEGGVSSAAILPSPEALWLLLGEEHGQEGQEQTQWCACKEGGCDSHQRTRPTLDTCFLEWFFLTMLESGF